MSVDHIRLILNRLDESILTESKISQILKGVPAGDSMLRYLLRDVISHDSNFEKSTLSDIMISRTRFAANDFALIIGTQGCAFKAIDNDDFTQYSLVNMFSPQQFYFSRRYLGVYWGTAHNLKDLKDAIGSIKSVYIATNLIDRKKTPRRGRAGGNYYDYIDTINETVLPVILSYENQAFYDLKNKINAAFRSENYLEAERLTDLATKVQKLYTNLKNPNSRFEYPFMVGVLQNLLLGHSMGQTHNFVSNLDHDKFTQFVKEIATGSTSNRLKVIRYIKDYLSGNM